MFFQDNIQASARAFGERLLADTLSESISKADEDLNDILSIIYKLYMTSTIERDLVRNTSIILKPPFIY